MCLFEGFSRPKSSRRAVYTRKIAAFAMPFYPRPLISRINILPKNQDKPWNQDSF